MKTTIAMMCAALAAGSAACANNKPAESADMVVPPGSRTAVKDDGSATGDSNTRPAATGNAPNATGRSAPAKTPDGERQAMPADAPATGASPPGTATPPDDRGTQRDGAAAPLTAMDQGNSKSDIDITASIRKTLVGDSSLSIGAKNVKIITVKGKVTLRGRVSSNDERAKIEAVARSVAGAAQVDNQLEVKP